jgi:hypothetical protein
MIVRHRFGDHEPDPSEADVETEAPFVGRAGSFTFDCPHVNGGEVALLLFQALGVSHRKNVLEINGVGIPGGIATSITPITPIVTPAGPAVFELQVWNANVMLVPRNVLRDNANVLRIESRNRNGGTDGNLDNFIIDNVVVLYKSREGRFPPVLESR